TANEVAGQVIGQPRPDDIGQGIKAGRFGKSATDLFPDSGVAPEQALDLRLRQAVSAGGEARQSLVNQTLSVLVILGQPLEKLPDESVHVVRNGTDRVAGAPQACLPDRELKLQRKDARSQACQDLSLLVACQPAAGLRERGLEQAGCIRGG